MRLHCLYSTTLGSSGPVQSIVRCRDDDSCGFTGEKKQACLVLLKLNPPADGTFSKIALQLEELPVCSVCPFQLSGISFKEKKGWTDSGTMTVALYCTNVSNRSVLILAMLHSGNVGRTTGYVNRIFFVSIVQFAQHLPCVSKHVTIVLPRRIDDNLQVLEPSPSAWTFRTSRLWAGGTRKTAYAVAWITMQTRVTDLLSCGCARTRVSRSAQVS